ncbi:ketopantoate reductase family protein [Rhodococcus sp. KBW08]|uniref:ketopantoate reductase family protein n=1 Tax=Rhodococcus sp. KBW08 TaxID=2144188 RepID=UPI001C8ABB01|nr:2-dehydropantoate 2-reductase [Rhodococcus sp. KBW08]
MTDIEYTIVGAGAIGGTLATYLSAAGCSVQLIDTDSAHVDAIQANGLALETPSETRRTELPAYTLETAPPTMRNVLLAVKAQATESAMTWIAPRLRSDGYVASMQNGMNEAIIAAHIGADRTIAAFVDLFADVIEPGLIKDGGAGAMAVGDYAGPADSERVKKLAHDLRLWGTPTVTDNVAGYLWSKLGFGAMLTATAVADEDMSLLIDRHRSTMNKLGAEIFEVAASQDVSLEGFDAFDPTAYLRGGDSVTREASTDKLVAWLATQSKTRSGIWRDIAVRHRRTEIAPQYEPIIQLAQSNSIEVPVLEDLIETIRRLEDGEIGMDERHLDRLDAKAVAT